jgi:hypothetical protein
MSAVSDALGPAYRHAAAQSFVHGYHLAVGIGTAFVLIAAVTALIGFRRPAEASETEASTVLSNQRSQQPSAAAPPTQT